MAVSYSMYNNVGIYDMHDKYDMRISLTCVWYMWYCHHHDTYFYGVDNESNYKVSLHVYNEIHVTTRICLNDDVILYDIS